MVPILGHVAGWNSTRIRELFAGYGLSLQDWERARTDRITLRETPALVRAESA
jgi:hypothetical protein